MKQREIKFRGRNYSGEWLYGGIVSLDGDKSRQWFISYTQDVEHREPRVRYDKVNRDTIGQYTGLKDKNGKEIYEGDLLDFDETHEGLHGFTRPEGVYYYDGAFCVTILYDSISIPINQNDCSSCIVIGNIHETPELITQ